MGMMDQRREQKCRAGVREESPPRAAQEGVRPEQALFTGGAGIPMALSPGYTGQIIRRRSSVVLTWERVPWPLVGTSQDAVPRTETRPQGTAWMRGQLCCPRSSGPRPRQPQKVLGQGGAGQEDRVSGGRCSSAPRWAGSGEGGGW